MSARKCGPRLANPARESADLSARGALTCLPFPRFVDSLSEVRGESEIVVIEAVAGDTCPGERCQGEWQAAWREAVNKGMHDLESDIQSARSEGQHGDELGRRVDCKPQPEVIRLVAQGRADGSAASN